MGGSQSTETISLFQADYIQKVLQDHQFFGTHTVLINKCSKETIIKKQITFYNAIELKEFLLEYQKAEKIPFSIIYPRAIHNKSQFQSCSGSNNLIVYYNFFQKNLGHVVQKHGKFSQARIWFLLNEISRSLQILAQQKRAHWGICPQTIYENSNKNWLIYDSYFVFGHDYQNFLLKKRKNNQLTSPSIANSMEYGLGINPNQGLDEDIYCLGYCILFAMTNHHPSNFSKDPMKRHLQAMEALHSHAAEHSTDLIKLIERMIDKSDTKRISLAKLRKNLKEKQIQIIQNDNQEMKESQKETQFTKYQSQRLMSKIENCRKIRQDASKRSQNQTNSPTQIFSPTQVYSQPVQIRSPAHFTSPVKTAMIQSYYPQSPNSRQFYRTAKSDHFERESRQIKAQSICNFQPLSPSYNRKRF